MSTAEPHPENAPEQVCLLWHAPDANPSDSLVRALTNRGLCVMPTASRHSVFAAACQYAKSARRVVIVLDGRETLGGVDRVLDALDRFSPGVICWEHCPGSNPPMVPVVRETGQALAQSSPVVSKPASGSRSASLRLVGEGDREQDQPKRASVSIPSASPGRTISSSDVLDADELNALLSGEMGMDRPKG